MDTNKEKRKRKRVQEVDPEKKKKPRKTREKESYREPKVTIQDLFKLVEIIKRFQCTFSSGSSKSKWKILLLYDNREPGRITEFLSSLKLDWIQGRALSVGDFWYV